MSDLNALVTKTIRDADVKEALAFLAELRTLKVGDTDVNLLGDGVRQRLRKIDVLIRRLNGEFES